MAKKHIPSAEEIIKVMKDASKALEAFLDKDNNLKNTDEHDYNLELWSSNLRHYATRLNNRIINK